jgi:ribonuclease HI
LPAISDDLERLLLHCENKNYPVCVGADSNAHSTAWGSPLTDARGDEFDETLNRYHLSLLNAGATPTFQTCRAESIIDISFVHSDLYDSMVSWQVLEEDFFSDHKCIEFFMNFRQERLGPIKNWRLTNWLKVECDLHKVGTAWSAPLEWDATVLEDQLVSFNAAIVTAITKHTPTFFPARRLRQNCWWKEELKIYRNLAKQKFRKWQGSGAVEDHRAYLEAKRAYQSEVAQSKHESWQTFCSTADSSKKLAQINKILQRNRNRTLGLIGVSATGVPNNPEESIHALLDEHFPGSVPEHPDFNRGNHKKVSIARECEWLSIHRIKTAISQFSPHKTPGLDGLKPLVLQHLPAPMLHRLGHLFEASILLEYVPELWRRSKAIFIPKHGKDDYTQPRSWRPISLMSFVFKTMERLLLWHLEETVLQTEGMHEDQHAFRKGRSTESALSDTVDYIEHQLYQQRFAVGVFLDIEGAFDNLLPDGVLASLRQRGTSTELLGWFNQYLKNRRVQVDHKGVHTSRNLVRGTPQGGVLSPVLWNLAFDSVLRIFDQGPIKASGYADDLALIARGPDIDTLVSITQQAIDKVTAWGRGQGLKFSASKSVAVVFTLKLKWSCKNLRMNGTEMEWQNSVKYLGVTLDSKLNWTPHVLQKIKKAKNMLFQYRQVVGARFGPKPLCMRWMFTGIIRPALCYGAIVWWRVTKNLTILERLRKLSRLAMLTWGNFRRSTPTAALEIIGYIPPLDLYLEGEVVKAWHRVKAIRAEIWDGIGATTLKRGHRRALTDLSGDFNIQTYKWDEIPELKKWARLYKVDTDSFKDGQPYKSTIQCFTDGSRLKDRAGCGVCIIFKDTIVKKLAIPLGIYPTVFQAEIMAISQAAEMLLEYAKVGNITIFCDSQAALLALDSTSAKSSVVLATMYALDTLALASNFRVTLAWIKAHVGFQGNETADLLAKEGTELTSEDPEPVIPVPSCQFKRDVNAAVTRNWQRRWNNYTEGRQSKLFWPEVNKSRSLELLKYDRRDYGMMIQVFTGHNYFNRHANVIDTTVSAECRFCFEAEESSEHLLCDCPVLNYARVKWMGLHQATTLECSQMPLNGLRRFTSMLRQRTDQGLE